MTQGQEPHSASGSASARNQLHRAQTRSPRSQPPYPLLADRTETAALPDETLLSLLHSLPHFLESTESRGPLPPRARHLRPSAHQPRRSPPVREMKRNSRERGEWRKEAQHNPAGGSVIRLWGGFGAESIQCIGSMGRQGSSRSSQQIIRPSRSQKVGQDRLVRLKVGCGDRTGTGGNADE
jgi:hypothetical protein